MDRVERERKIREHLEAIRRLEESERPEQAPAGKIYILWHVVVGAMVGAIAALISLAANAIGALAFGLDPMQLVRVYLTFPMGEAALHAEDGLVLFVGCTLYLITGAVYGIVFQLGMRTFFPGVSTAKLWQLATAFGIAIWLINFYAVLSWLQPLLLGGNWIVTLVPIWVAAATHLCFAWFLALGHGWNRRSPHGIAVAAVLVALGAGGATGCGTPAQALPPTPDGEGESLEYARWETYDPGEHLAYNHRTNLIQRGGEVYAKYCVGCHGVYGDGKGPAAERLITQPRDLTSGVYKFRSTDSGSLPMESDLYRTITRGLSGVSMPGFPLMPHRDKLAVIEYVKAFYPDWDQDASQRVLIPVPLAPSDLRAETRRLRGSAVYAAMQCGQCHGVDGRGTGATRTEYVDAWGNPQKPYDFTRGSLKGGDLPEDIYRTFHTGLRSIMPSYGGMTLGSVTRENVEALMETGSVAPIGALLDDFPSGEAMASVDAGELGRLSERNSWDLVSYILSLRRESSTAAAVLGTPGPGEGTE